MLCCSMFAPAMHLVIKTLFVEQPALAQKAVFMATIGERIVNKAFEALEASPEDFGIPTSLGA